MAYATQTALASEIAARKAADAALQTQINDLKAQVAALTPAPSPVLNTKPAASVADVKALLLDDTVDVIRWTAGTYRVDPAQNQSAGSLWLGSAYAGRTRPVLIDATGVVLDGGGATYFMGIGFNGGAHDIAVQGVNITNGTPTETGVIVFGGYAGMAAPHHIRLSGVSIYGCSSHTTGSNDHGVYFSEAVGGPHDITIDGLTVTATTGTPYALSSAIHAYHSDAANANAWNVAVSNLHVSGTYQAIILWDATLHDWTISNSTIQSALDTAVRYEGPAKGPITLNGVSSTGSGSHGFYSSLSTPTAPIPPGISLVNCSLA